MSVFAGRIQGLIKGQIGYLSVAALLCLSGPTKLIAESSSSPAQPSTTQETPTIAPQTTTAPENTPAPHAATTVLPTVAVDAPRRPPRRRVQRATAVPVTAPPPAPPVAPPQEAPVDMQDARTGTAGVYSNSTAVATKTNTPLLNIPQSVNVVTKSFIRDQSFQSITDVTRYVPGVAIH